MHWEPSGSWPFRRLVFIPLLDRCGPEWMPHNLADVFRWFLVGHARQPGLVAQSQLVQLQLGSSACATSNGHFKLWQHLPFKHQTDVGLASMRSSAAAALGVCTVQAPLLHTPAHHSAQVGHAEHMVAWVNFH